MAKGSGGRITAVAAASWVLATVVTSLVVWRAVAVFTDGQSTDVLSAPQVSARLGSATTTAASTSASPAVTASRSVSGETPPRATSESSSAQSSLPPYSATPTVGATPVVRTWTVTGGSVSVSCQGQVIALVYARPQDGWRVETERHGTDRVDVAFERVGQGTDLRAACVSGVPQQTTVATEGDH